MNEPSAPKKPGINHSVKAAIPARAVIPAKIVKGSSGCGCGGGKKAVTLNNQNQTNKLVDSMVNNDEEETKGLSEQNNQKGNFKQSQYEAISKIKDPPLDDNQLKNKSFFDFIKKRFNKIFHKNFRSNNNS